MIISRKFVLLYSSKKKAKCWLIGLHLNAPIILIGIGQHVIDQVDEKVLIHTWF